MIGKTALLLGIAVAAGGEPSSVGTARLGTLTVTASVLVSPKAADLRAVWNDIKAPCAESRQLRVRRAGTFPDMNCAEGGPNVGFTLSARAADMACPNGRWKPGLYHFLTRAREPKRGLEASASLDWTNTRRC